MQEENSRVVAGSLWSLGCRLLTALSGLLVTMLITRQLSQDDAGRYFSLLSFVSIAAVIIGSGMCGAVVRLVSQALAEGRPQRARAVTMTSFCVLAFTALLAGLWLAAPGSQARVIRWLNLEAGVPFLLIWIWIVLLALQTLIGEVFRGFHGILCAALFGGACSALLSLFALSVTGALGITTLDSIILAIVAAVGVSLVLASIVLGRMLALQGGRVSLEWRGLPATAASMWVTQLTLVVLLQADIWILQSQDDAAAVALYGAATRMTVLMTLPLGVLNAAMMPVISARHTRAEYLQLQSMLRGAAALAAWPALLAMLVFASAGSALLGWLFGAAYAAAAPILLVLGLGQLVNVLGGSAGYTLMMTGRHGDMMWITVIAGSLTIIAGLFAVRTHGALGLACASAGGLALQSLAMWGRVRQTRGLWTHPSWRNLMQPLAALRQLR